MGVSLVIVFYLCIIDYYPSQEKMMVIKITEKYKIMFLM